MLNGIKLSSGDTAAVQAVAAKARKQDNSFIVPVELRGRRTDGRAVVFSRAEVVLVNSLPVDRPRLSLVQRDTYPLSVANAYSQVLFHGPALHGLTSIDAISREGIAATTLVAPQAAKWMDRPLRKNWLADPQALDAAFQAIILWGVQYQGTPNLPSGFGHYRQFRRTFPVGSVRLVARITSATGPIIRADVEWIDADDKLIARLENGEFVSDANLAAAFRQNGSALTAV